LNNSQGFKNIILFIFNINQMNRIPIVIFMNDIRTVVFSNICIDTFENGNTVDNIKPGITGAVKPKSHIENDQHSWEYTRAIHMESRLSQKEIGLLEWENDIDRREKIIIEKDRLVTEKIDLNIRLNEDVTKHREELYKNIVEYSDQKRQVEYLQNRVDNKDITINELKSEIKTIRDEVLKMIRKIEKNTDKSTFFDQILPYLPSAINLLCYYLLNKKLDDQNSLDPLLKEMDVLFKDMKPSDMEKLKKIVIDIIKNQQAQQKKEGTTSKSTS